MIQHSTTDPKEILWAMQNAGVTADMLKPKSEKGSAVVVVPVGPGQFLVFENRNGHMAASFFEEATLELICSWLESRGFKINPSGIELMFEDESKNCALN